MKARPGNYPEPQPVPVPLDGWPVRLFAALFGAFLGLTLLKFGNPPIMESLVPAPTDIWEFLFLSSWPIGWAYSLLGVFALVGLITSRWKINAPLWLVALPLVWLAWESLAASQSLAPQASFRVVAHFGACVVCFCLGLFSLSRAGSLAPFWAGITVPFLLVLAVGWEQHFGGLAETRRYFYANIYPTLKAPLPPEYYKRLNSTRIFSTLFYPNTLAGALLLLLPPVLTAVATVRRLTVAARTFLVTVIALAALACLSWSGSKAGWLLALVLGLVALFRLPLDTKARIALVSAVLLLGLAGFSWKFATLLSRGAPSASARLDYWQAALRITAAHPLLGSGPGTFGPAYLAVKRPESEPAKLTHNDYLEQACDSGLPGFIVYSVFVLAALVWSAPRTPQRKTAPRTWPALAQDRMGAAVWLGVLGWSLQGFVEFGLYVPALAWPAFALIGWLLQMPSTSPDSLGRMRSKNESPVSKRP